MRGKYSDPERPVFVYTLTDPRSPEDVRYVGVTVNVTRRLGGHCRIKKGDTSHRVMWLASLIRAGIHPVMVVVEDTVMRDRDDRERHWIALYRSAGSDLVNSTAGGDGLLGATEPVREKLRAAWDVLTDAEKTFRIARLNTPEANARGGRHLAIALAKRTPEQKAAHYENLAASRRGIVKLTDEQRANMSKVQREWYANWTPEQREARRQILLQRVRRKLTPAEEAERRRKITEARASRTYAPISDENRANVAAASRARMLAMTPEERTARSEMALRAKRDKEQRTGEKWRPTEEHKAKLAIVARNRLMAMTPEQRSLMAKHAAEAARLRPKVITDESRARMAESARKREGAMTPEQREAKREKVSAASKKMWEDRRAANAAKPTQQ